MTPLVLSYRQAAKLLRVDRGSTLPWLIKSGRLRVVPWGKSTRIPLAEVQRLAAEGFDAKGVSPRAAHAPRMKRGTVDPESLRRTSVDEILRKRTR